MPDDNDIPAGYAEWARLYFGQIIASVVESFATLAGKVEESLSTAKAEAERLLNEVLEPKAAAPRATPKPTVAPKNLATVQDLHERSGLQKATLARNTEQARSVAISLITADGALSTADLVRLRAEVADSAHAHLPQSKHLLKSLARLEEPAVQARLAAIKAPPPTSPACGLLRASLGLPRDAPLDDAHARQAAVAALLTKLRQSPAASCGPTSLTVQVQQSNPELFLQDLDSLLQTGKLTRVVSKGSKVQAKDFDRIVKRALRAVDVSKKVEDQLFKDGLKAIASKPELSMQEIEAAIREAAKAKNVTLDAAWTPLTKIEVPLNRDIPPLDLETTIDLTKHPPDKLHELPGVRAALEALGGTDTAAQQKLIREAIDRHNKSTVQAVKGALRGEPDGFGTEPNWLKLHCAEAVPAKIKDASSPAEIEAVLRTEIDEVLKIATPVNIKRWFGKPESDPDLTLAEMATERDKKAAALLGKSQALLANPPPEIRPQDLLASLTAGDGAARTAAANAYQAQQENLLLRALEFTMANMAMALDGGTQLKEPLIGDFQGVIDGAVQSVKEPALQGKLKELLNDEFYKYMKSLQPVFDPTRPVRGGDGMSSRGGLILLSKDNPDTKVDSPERLVPEVRKMLADKVGAQLTDTGEKEALNKLLDDISPQLLKKWPGLMLYVSSSAQPDDLLPAYYGLNAIETDELKAKTPGEVVNWLGKTSATFLKNSPPVSEKDSPVVTVWNAPHAFSVRPTTLAGVTEAKVKADEGRKNQERMATAFPLNLPTDGAVRRFLMNAFSGFRNPGPDTYLAETEDLLRKTWTGKEITMTDLKKIADQAIAQVLADPNEEQVCIDFAAGFWDANILEVAPLVELGDLAARLDEALGKLPLDTANRAAVKTHVLAAAKGSSSMSQLQQLIEAALDSLGTPRTGASAPDKVFDALRQPAGVVFADSNWDGAGDEGDHEQVFTMVANPRSGEIELWQMNEDGSGPRKLGEEWISGLNQVTGAGWTMPVRDPAKETS